MKQNGFILPRGEGEKSHKMESLRFKGQGNRRHIFGKIWCRSRLGLSMDSVRVYVRKSLPCIQKVFEIRESPFATATNRNAQVSAPPGAGWLSPEEAAVALSSPQTPQDQVLSPSSSSSPPSSSLVDSLPPSAIGLVLAMMRCNPCEVLGSLRPGIGTDGRISLIGRVNNSGRVGSASAVDVGEAGHRGSKTLLWERHPRDGGGMEIRQDNAPNGSDTFRCSLEVAWDKDEGGIFVQRFGMEPNEVKPR